VTTVDAPELVGDETWFVVLDDDRIVVEDTTADLSALRRAVALAPPFRAHGVRRGGSLWVVGARRIETVTLVDDPGGDAVELAWNGTERTVRIDGEPTLAGVPELEALGGSRHRTYVVTATRLVGPEWEVAIAPL
jgi:hypothetical protein